MSAKNAVPAIPEQCGILYILLISLFIFIIQACAPKTHVSYAPRQQRVYPSEQHTANRQHVLLLKHHYEKWRGTPYAVGGMSASGIDCSGFTVLAFRDLFGVSLPRTAGEQAETGREVARSSLKTGDLVFFNTGPTKKHVGIYLADDQFIHASYSQGVTLSSLDDSYWQDRYWQARRLQSSGDQRRTGKAGGAAYRR